MLNCKHNRGSRKSAYKLVLHSRVQQYLSIMEDRDTMLSVQFRASMSENWVFNYKRTTRPRVYNATSCTDHLIIQYLFSSGIKSNNIFERLVSDYSQPRVGQLQSPLAHPLQPQWTHSITFSSLRCLGTLQTQVVAKLWSRVCMHRRQQRRS
jgi:hypothetical protein